MPTPRKEPKTILVFGHKRYAYVLASTARSTCPCGSPATRRYTGLPCCERCYEIESRYDAQKKYTGTSVWNKRAQDYAGATEEYRVASVGIRSNLYRELKRTS